MLAISKFLLGEMYCIFSIKLKCASNVPSISSPVEVNVYAGIGVNIDAIASATGLIRTVKTIKTAIDARRALTLFLSKTEKNMPTVTKVRVYRKLNMRKNTILRASSPCGCTPVKIMSDCRLFFFMRWSAP